MDENNRNFILAIVLSIGVLFAWQFFFVPKHPPQQQPGTDGAADADRRSQARRSRHRAETPTPAGAALQPGAATGRYDDARGGLAASPRVAIDTPSLKGSIALKGARIDDLTLKDYRETVEPSEPEGDPAVAGRRAASPITPSMAGSAETGKDRTVPRTADTLWTAQRSDRSRVSPRSRSPTTTARGSSSPAPSRSTTIIMFTVDDTVANSGSEPVTLYPYGLVSSASAGRQVRAIYILHEGLIGVVDDGGLEQITYQKADR